MKRVVGVGVAVVWALALAVVVYGQTFTQLGNIMNLGGATDSNGSLRVYGRAYSSPQTALTAIGNLSGRTDSNGSLAVTVAGGTVTPDAVRIPNGTLPEYGGCEWVSNFFNCITTTNGGTARSMRVGGAANLVIQANGSDQWQFTGSTGNFTNLSSGVISSGTAPGTALANTFFSPGIAFASLATPTNGTSVYCTDCAPTTPATCPGTKASCVCTSGGVGSWAFRANSVWYCPF